MKLFRSAACGVSLILTLGACNQEPAPASPTSTTAAPTSTAAALAQPPAPQAPTPPPIQRVQVTPEAIEKARADLEKFADRDRRTKAALSFEDFEGTVYKEPFDGGKYIVNGDTTVGNRKQLREFYELNVKPPQTTRLVVNQVGGLDDKWNAQQKKKLTYCVSNTFGSRQSAVTQQMASATGEWEKVAGVDFVHDPAQDASCVPSNAAVVFDVRPVNVDGEYLARAFFPSEPRAARNVLIDESSFALPAEQKLQLGGILRHELGHTLGFRHEHTRPEAGKCFEDQDWKPLTSYDAFSVMHYPQCNGRGDWSLNLTARDKNASACLYGAAPGFTIDMSLINVTCATEAPAAHSGESKTESFNGQSVTKGGQKFYGPFTVLANTIFEVSIGGATASGDADVYLRFGAQPTTTQYDCRPFTEGSVEACSGMVPANATKAFVTVRGYEAGRYDVKVTRVQAATPVGGS